MHGRGTTTSVAGMLAGQSRNKQLCCPVPPPKRMFPPDFIECQSHITTQNQKPLQFKFILRQILKRYTNKNVKELCHFTSKTAKEIWSFSNQKARALTPQQNPIMGLCRQKTFCKLATSFLYIRQITQNILLLSEHYGGSMDPHFSLNSLDHLMKKWH